MLQRMWQEEKERERERKKNGAVTAVAKGNSKTTSMKRGAPEPDEEELPDGTEAHLEEGLVNPPPRNI